MFEDAFCEETETYSSGLLVFDAPVAGESSAVLQNIHGIQREESKTAIKQNEQWPNFKLDNIYFPESNPESQTQYISKEFVPTYHLYDISI